MWLCIVRILFFVCCFHSSFQMKWRFKRNSVDEWNRMATIKRAGHNPMSKRSKNSVPAETDFLVLPEYVFVTSETDQKDLFKPEMDPRPLPDSVQKILFPSIPEPEPSEKGPVEVLCHIDRIYVRIKRDIFKTSNAWRFLKLGSCVVNQATDNHYYFLYLLKDCNFTFESNVDNLTITNVLHYLPMAIVLRDVPFDIAVNCIYHRYVHSYKVGIKPLLQKGALYKSLRRKRPAQRSVQLIAQDESGNRMTTAYNMGDTMFFELKQIPDGTESSASERLYINKCFITSSRVPSNEDTAIIDNFGCMVDGTVSEDSKFIPGPSMTSQRFSVNAGVLLEMATMTSSSTKLLYMHCEVYVGVHPPTEGSKACSYDIEHEIWTELYGDDSVCLCCDSACGSTLFRRAAKSKVISQPWKVNLTYTEEDWIMKK